MNNRSFLYYEFTILTMTAGLGTRNPNYPVYQKQKNREQLKVYIRKKLLNLTEIESYKNGTMSSDEHVQFIKDVAQDISNQYPEHLFEKRLRIGVAQKLINLYLKYLWCAEFTKEPPHCPIDGIIRDKAGIDYNWTSSDSIDEYRKAIEALRSISEEDGKSLSYWELEIFRE